MRVRPARFSRPSALLAAPLALLVATGCERPETPREPLVPAVKTIVLEDASARTQRTLAGTLSVGDETRLSFAIGGTLASVPLREGDRFEAGQEIARLDPAEAERALARRKGELAAARGRLKLADEDFRRQTALEGKGVASRARLDRAAAFFETARAEVRVAEIAVADAEEDLRRTRLVAERGGIVTRLLARKSEEVSAGQTIYEVGAPSEMEVSVLVPEQLVPALSLGGRLSLVLTGLGDARAEAEITEIGAVAEAGNAFRIKARIDALPPGARSGMTASVTLATTAEASRVFSIPLSALVYEPGAVSPTVGGKVTLFVLDEAQAAIRRVETTAEGVVGNRVLVADGLEPGQRVVVAGVALLRDGQKARPWIPAE